MEKVIEAKLKRLGAGFSADVHTLGRYPRIAGGMIGSMTLTKFNET